MIIFLYSTIIVLVATLIMMNVYRIRFLNAARRRGKLPPKGRATMFDIRQLLMEGEKDLAVQLYCEIFHVTLPKANKDIEELQRSLKV